VLPIIGDMVIDYLMGVSGLLLGTLLVAFSARLADLMQEGDEMYREQHPWVESYEPQVRWLASTTGRWWILRSWVLLAAVGFCLIGAMLVLRAAL
jgi:hypothetical protein